MSQFDITWFFFLFLIVNKLPNMDLSEDASNGPLVGGVVGSIIAILLVVVIVLVLWYVIIKRHWDGGRILLIYQCFLKHVKYIWSENCVMYFRMLSDGFDQWSVYILI